MPHPPEKASEPIADLPNPELNPLLNPLLGRHLGRWAQVYFTNVPEKREQAIYELLHELEAEERAGGAPGEGSSESAVPEPALLVCERCHHQHTRIQNFCGMCGAPLLPHAPVEGEAAIGSEAHLEGLHPPQFGDEPQRVEHTEREEAWGETRATSRAMIFADDPAPVVEDPMPSFRERPIEARTSESSHDIDWLRERKFAGEIEERSTGRWKVAAGLGVALAIGALVYWRLEMLRPAPAAGSRTASPVTAQEPVAPSSVPGSLNPGSLNVETPQVNAAVSAREQTSARTSGRTGPREAPVSASSEHGGGRIQPAGGTETRPASTGRNTSGETLAQDNDAESGATELALAEKLLSGSNGVRNSAAAIPLLWKAVGKQNTTATLLLSDLYATGDGVSKNCDQARVLLDVALRKNAAGAASRLQNLQSSCR